MSKNVDKKYVVNTARNALIMPNNRPQMYLILQQRYFADTSKKVIQKTAEETGELIGNKIANEIEKVSRTLSQGS